MSLRYITNSTLFRHQRVHSHSFTTFGHHLLLDLESPTFRSKLSASRAASCPRDSDCYQHSRSSALEQEEDRSREMSWGTCASRMPTDGIKVGWDSREVRSVHGRVVPPDPCSSFLRIRMRYWSSDSVIASSDPHQSDSPNASSVRQVKLSSSNPSRLLPTTLSRPQHSDARIS